MPPAHPVITLTTDFGLQDEYVGVMKGVILNRCPTATVIDLTHEIRPQDVQHGAFILEAAVPYFPRGTIHVVVVDPGVGTERDLLLLRGQDQFFLGPDNGVLSSFLDQNTAGDAYLIDCPEHYLSPVSNTFHGRDILAPVAAALANGVSPQKLGNKVIKTNLKKLAPSQLQIDSIHGNITGLVCRVDHFGNLTTNIQQKDVAQLGVLPEDLLIEIAGQQITGLAQTYGDSAPGTLTALFGSRHYLEVAIPQGNASDVLQTKVGDPVTVTAHRAL